MINNKPADTQLLAEIAGLRSKMMELELQLQEVELQHRVEAETRRDLMSALTRASGLDQTLEILLVNLRNLVPYDLAGLFLLTHGGHMVQDFSPELLKGPALQTFPDEHSLVTEIKATQRPLIITDIQADSRFENWKEMELIHGWMGVPILIDKRMIGFLSLGSLQKDAYTKTEAGLVAAYSNQLADILRQAWQPEMTSKNNEGLEVISRISHALGQAESQEDTYRVILDQINKLFGPVEGAFIFPNSGASELVVRFTLDEANLGMKHARCDDLLWQVYERGKTISVSDIPGFLHRAPGEFYTALLKRKKSAILIPLTTRDAAFGILLLAFPQFRNFSGEDMRLFDTLAQITSTTLRRLFVLEGVEKQLSMEKMRLIEQTEQAAVMEERQRLARELHDSVTQLIYSQVLYAGAGLKVLGNGDMTLSQQYLNRIHQVARQALKEMRLLVYELRPEDFLEDGLVGALQRRLDSVERRSDINVQLKIESQPVLDEAEEIALYYIAMEALNNILKHSGASSVVISLRGDGNRVELEIADDGQGFDVSQKEASSGRGLLSMRERAAAFRGSLQVISTPGSGTRIVASIEGRNE
ncbi:MAG: sensor histidine kinase [Anaerolineales bacterium]